MRCGKPAGFASNLAPQRERNPHGSLLTLPLSGSETRTAADHLAPRRERNLARTATHLTLHPGRTRTGAKPTPHIKAGGVSFPTSPPA